MIFFFRKLEITYELIGRYTKYNIVTKPVKKLVNCINLHVDIPIVTLFFCLLYPCFIS